MSTENLNNHSEILDRFRLAFESLGLPKSHVAKIIGYSTATISDILNNKTPLSIKFSKIFCAEFGFSHSWIQTGEGSMYSTTVSEPTSPYGPSEPTNYDQQILAALEPFPEAQREMNEFLQLSKADQMIFLGEMMKVNEESRRKRAAESGS